MRIILCVQYYQADDALRQSEIDSCLSANAENQHIDLVCLFTDSHSLPPSVLPSRKIRIYALDGRLRFSDWLGLLSTSADAVFLLANSDIVFGDDLRRLVEVLPSADNVMALSRYNYIEGKSPQLNRFPQWTQDSWAIRSDAQISQSLLSSSHIPIGLPGSDNRISHVFWSHGFNIVNPCYFIRSVHHHSCAVRSYDKFESRLYGSAVYAHPSLGIAEPSELEHAIWSKSAQPVNSIVLNRQAVELGLYELSPHGAYSHALSKGRARCNLLLSRHHLCITEESAYSLFATPHAHSSFIFELAIPPHHCLTAVQLRSSNQITGSWRLLISGELTQTKQWQPLEDLDPILLQPDGFIHIIAVNIAKFIHPKIRLELKRVDHTESSTNSGIAAIEILAFAMPLSLLGSGHSQLFPATELGSDVLQSPSDCSSSTLDSHLTSVLTCNLDLSSWSLLHKYNNRFQIYSKGLQLLFLDRFWPMSYLAKDKSDMLSFSSNTLLQLFIYGFIPAALEWKTGYIKSNKTYDRESLFWQFPCRTEAEAFDRHKNLGADRASKDQVNLYIGLPWATWIDLKRTPQMLLNAFASRISSIRNVLDSHGINLLVHSVCQHIYWDKLMPTFLDIGITDVWLSHKPRDYHDPGNLRTHGWSLYPVNIRDPSRRAGIRYISADKKPILASFRGAFMPHYESRIRSHLKSLGSKPGFVIELDNLWHFNSIVYDHQVLSRPLDEIRDMTGDILRYNDLLATSVFSLCPAGAGPNTLRLWESLSIGSIPVILSDRFLAPVEPPIGCTPWIVHPECDLSSLEARLRSFTVTELLKMQKDAMAYSEYVESMTCFM